MNEYYNQSLEISNESAELLGAISKWTRFLSILGFVMIALMALGILSAAIMMTSVNYYEMSRGYMFYDPGMVSWPYITLYIIMLIIYTIPVYYLYKFSTRIKMALLSGSSTILTDAIRFLKKHYTFIGILTIIWIIMVIITIIMMSMGMANTGM